MKRELKPRKRNTTFGANGMVKSGRHDCYHFVTSAVLTSNIVGKKQATIPDLFIDTTEHGLQEKALLTLQNNKGKGVHLTPLQTKAVIGIAMAVDAQLGHNPEFQQYIEQLPDKYRRMQELAEMGEPLSATVETSVSVLINVAEFTKRVSGGKGGQQLASIREELNNLANTNYIIKMGDYTYYQPLITIKGGIVSAEAKWVKVEIGDAFMYGIRSQFSKAPLTLLSLWNEYGDNSELTTLLIMLLQKVRGNFVAKAKGIVEAKEKELRKKKLTPEKMAKELEAVGREALTYRESFRSILERLPNTDCYYQVKNGKKYYRKDREIKFINKSRQSLIDMGIITECYISDGSLGDTLLNFVINPMWLQEEKEFIQGLPFSIKGETEATEVHPE